MSEKIDYRLNQGPHKSATLAARVASAPIPTVALANQGVAKQATVPVKATGKK